MIVVEKMKSIPKKASPYEHDVYNMGQKLGSNLTVMFGNHCSEFANYLIVINTMTGERIKINLSNKKGK